MIQDKELLLKDLCARLPYGVKVAEATQGYFTLIGLTKDRGFTTCEVEDCHNDFPIENIKPYLFPMSSMTEGQKNHVSQLLLDTQIKYYPYKEDYNNLFISSVKQANALIRYCLDNHLDINGFIEKGLAIDATGKSIY